MRARLLATAGATVVVVVVVVGAGAGAAAASVSMPSQCYAFLDRTRATLHAPSLASTSASVGLSRRRAALGRWASPLGAKKRSKGGRGGRGFGKGPTPTPPSSSSTQPGNGAADDAGGAAARTPATTTTTTTTTTPYDAASSALESSSPPLAGGGGLSSLEGAASDVPQPELEPELEAELELELDPSSSPEERAEQILRQKYGLRTAEETEADVRKSRAQAERAKALTDAKKRMDKARQVKDDEFDIFSVLPAPLLLGIDAFLKVGTAVTTLLFVAAGIAITVEAWAAATGNQLPPDLDDFIFNVVEPSFTPGLFVLLGFSVSLGLFASAQLGSGSSQYSEDP